MVSDTSLCGLGQTAPNPVLSTLRYFRREYEKLAAMHIAAQATAEWPCSSALPARRELRTMSVMTLTIDDQTVTRAREAADDPAKRPARCGSRAFPTLCHLDGVTEVGACRLCLVETSRHPIACCPSCVTKVAEGMEVHTATPRCRNIAG